MREAVINLDGVLHYAVYTQWAGGCRTWNAYCVQTHGIEYWGISARDVIHGRPTCVQCIAREAVCGKDLEPIEIPCR